MNQEILRQAQDKQCQNCKNQFTIDPEDFVFFEKIQVPAPTWCWRCRAMRRMSFRNMTHLYARTCAATGKKIYTGMPPEAPMPVYDFQYWISDAWDPMEYGREYDFSQPFFEQIKELYAAVPWAMMWAEGRINSDYSMSAWVKNCYLCFDSGFSEDSAYSVSLQRSKQCFDVINTKFSELCSNSINISHSFKTFFSRNCVSCNEVWFSQDCVGCSNCFGCTGLRNKNYYIFNEPFTKEAYHEKLAGMGLDSWTGIKNARQEAETLWLKYPVKFQHSVQAQGSTGDYLFNVSRLRNCFFSDGTQDCAHSQSIIYSPIKDCMDVTSSGEAIELCYEAVASGLNMAKTFFSFDIVTATNAQYAINCRNVNNVFGCVGLRKKEYCIFNKQYSKEEYHALVSKIIKHMHDMPYTDTNGRIYGYGEFFPPEMSPFGYNTTQGQEYFPLTEEDARTQGFPWKASETKHYSTTRSSQSLPDSINETGDEILNEVINCLHAEDNDHPWDCESNCATAFKITAQELAFYRQMQLPLPRACFHCRHFERVAWRNKPALYQRTCQCEGAQSSNEAYQNQTVHNHGTNPCPNEFETSYAPDQAEIIYCESCYQNEVI